MSRKKILQLNIKELLKIEERFPNLAELSNEELRELLYRRSDLTWKLDSAQREVYDFFTTNKEDIVVAAISRQTGKSFTAITMAFEACLKYTNYIVRYASGDAKGALKIIRSNILNLIAECPEDLRPKFDQKINAWKFPNNSLLYLEGVDGTKADSIRGGAANLIIIDEAAFISNLIYVTENVFIPMTTTTDGKIFIISTPPKSKGHEFLEFVKAAKQTGAYFELNIYDYLEKVIDDVEFFKSRITLDRIEKIRKKILPETFAKEYLLKYETNTDDAVIPEFTTELKAQVVREVRRPKGAIPYVAMDQAGVRDLIAIVFGYYDPFDDKIIVEDELKFVSKATNTKILAEGIKKKELELWANEHGEFNTPIKRYCDINEQFMLRDLKKDYNLKFVTIDKFDKKEAVDALRTLLYNEVIAINPKCRDTIFHLENATWNKQGTSYDRSTAAGHYDFVDAMVYFVRAIKRRKAEPQTQAPDYANTMNYKPKIQQQLSTEVLKKIFAPKIRRYGR